MLSFRPWVSFQNVWNYSWNVWPAIHQKKKKKKTSLKRACFFQLHKLILYKSPNVFRLYSLQWIKVRSDWDISIFVILIDAVSSDYLKVHCSRTKTSAFFSNGVDFISPMRNYIFQPLSWKKKNEGGFEGPGWMCHHSKAIFSLKYWPSLFVFYFHYKLEM